MSSRSGTCPYAPRWDRHFSGRLTPPEEHAARLHLPSCPECRQRYERNLLLARLRPGSLETYERLGRGLGLVSRWRPASLRGAAWVIPALAALVLVVERDALRESLRQSEAPANIAAEATFTARGTTPGSSFSVHRLRKPAPAAAPGPSGAPESLEALGRSVRAEDELVFSYVNVTPDRWLLIFGVDELSNVYWYHPAWSDARENPSALRADATGKPQTLPEAIAHPFKGRRLTLYSVLAPSPLTVRQVEDQLSRASTGPGDGEAVDVVGLFTRQGASAERLEVLEVEVTP
jgi:hypothetical protein